MGVPVRRVTAGLAFVAVMYTGGLAIALATDSNGRGDSTPSTPVEQPEPNPILDDVGRSPGAAPSAIVAAAPTSDSPEAPVDNGRGRPDPPFGPFAVSVP